jgi:hypothetical protein
LIESRIKVRPGGFGHIRGRGNNHSLGRPVDGGVDDRSIGALEIGDRSAKILDRSMAQSISALSECRPVDRKSRPVDGALWMGVDRSTTLATGRRTSDSQNFSLFFAVSSP